MFVFIIIMIFVFHIDKFDFDFRQAGGGQWTAFRWARCSDKEYHAGYTLAFIGIEGAVVLRRAQSQDDVGKAMIMGFVGCLIVYVRCRYSLDLDPTGTGCRATPSTAGVLERAVGTWGSWIMNIADHCSGQLACLTWITAEMPLPRQNGTFPRRSLGNANGLPCPCRQARLQLAPCLLFSNNAWNMMLSITAVMVLPAYLISTLFLWKTCEDGQYPQGAATGRASALACGFLGSAYGLWLIYAAGLHYLLMASVFIAIGIPVYIWSRKQHPDQNPMFLKYEKVLLVLLVLVALFSLYLFMRGIVKL
ncbi:MAG: hypothetical protein ACLSAH_17400 [Bilophila wadsworthia]